MNCWLTGAIAARTVFLSSHVMPEVERVCDRIAHVAQRQKSSNT